MKKTLLLTVVMLASIKLSAQDTLYIQQKNGTVLKFSTSDIDSMTFTPIGGNDSSIVTADTTNSNIVSDIDGNKYPVVKIGDQFWMGADLKTTRFSNGDRIPTTCPVNEDVTGANLPYQWAFEGLECNTMDFGRLYTWFVAGDQRNVCPTGWHVPSDSEWTTLTVYLGGTKLVGGTVGAEKLKDSTGLFWSGSNAEATNETGFGARAGGFRRESGTFEYKLEAIHWWTSTWDTTVNTNGNGYPGVYRSLSNTSDLLYRYSHIANHGMHIRCIKN